MSKSGGVGALYLHLPFCRAKCFYCDFASWQTAPDSSCIDGYLEALAAQLEACAEAGLFDACQSAYIGGGTPTLVGARLGSLVALLRKRVPGISELSCEANPESLSDELIAGLVAAGLTRLSLGVQSSSNAELQALGRIHSSERALAALQAAVSSGVRVSADLMCAIPQQTAQSWQRSLEEVLACGVGHVSVYPLAIEEGTALEQRAEREGAPWNNEDIQAERMEAAAHTLEQAGLIRYEVASYARAGQRCAHNCAYWSGVPYLGLGTSAASMFDREGYARIQTVFSQLPALSPEVARIRLRMESGREELAAAPRDLSRVRFSRETLTQREALAEDLMLSQRMVDGASAELLEQAREIFGRTQLERTVEHLCRRGLAHIDAGRLRPTHSGWLLGNELFGELWALAEEPV